MSVDSVRHNGAQPRLGFFTDTTLCIGCKACEVACKQWNELPDDGLNFTGESYDNTSELNGNTWRHVAFIEQLPAAHTAPPGGPHGALAADAPALDDLHSEASEPFSVRQYNQDGRWLMSSDVCKHCTHAACLDVCPTGALFRSEFGTVVLQGDVCNGCGYCIPACPFGVVDRRPQDGQAAKCTMCYDRLRVGEQPACAKACPTQSIQFGPLEELRTRARERLNRVRPHFSGARLYGAEDTDGVGGFGAFFLLLDEPQVYGLPPAPVVTTKDLPQMWGAAAVAASLLVGLMSICAFRRR